MKKLIVTASLALVAMLGVTTATAAELSAEIPFPFVVKNRMLPAGEYDISINAEGVLRVQGAAGGRAVAVFTLAEGQAPSAGAKLLFTKLNGQHVLSQVWRHGASRDILGARFVPDVASSGTDGDTIAIDVNPRSKG